MDDKIKEIKSRLDALGQMFSDEEKKIAEAELVILLEEINTEIEQTIVKMEDIQAGQGMYKV